MKIPLRDGSQFDITPFLDGYKAKYPNIHDLGAELAKMHLWLARNPARWPMKPFRFVDAWLGKIKRQPVKLHLAGGRMTETEILDLCKKHGIEPRPGEDWGRVMGRLREVMK
jgi:hypothetical protein